MKRINGALGSSRKTHQELKNGFFSTDNKQAVRAPLHGDGHTMRNLLPRIFAAPFVLLLAYSQPSAFAQQAPLATAFAADAAGCQTPLNAQPGTATATPATPHPIPVTPAGPLGEVDRSFIDSYNARETLVLANQSPFIVVSGSNLILHRGDTSTTVKVIPDSYHALKDIAHIPFTVYLLLAPVSQNLVSLDAQTTSLNTVANCIDAAMSALSPDFFSESEMARQRDILVASRDLIRSTLDSKSVLKEQLISFTKTMGPLMLQNANDAGCIQIDATHTQMMRWKAELTQDEWGSLTVVNLARHQARYRNAATQYFHWLLGDNGPAWSYPGESMRVIFAETLGPVDKASNELAIVEIDADASEAFFGNRWRLSEDILSDGAERCIKKLPKQDRAYSAVQR